jgi:hypothetical protein
VRAYLDRIHTTDELADIAVEGYEVVEEEAGKSCPGCIHEA